MRICSLFDQPLIADENIHAAIIVFLRENGYDVYSIREKSPGISDQQVLSVAQEKKGILITEDSDFGELVFSHGLKTVGIIFLRYSWKDVPLMCRSLLKVLSTYPLQGSFCTLTTQKVRIRTLPPLQ